MKKFCVGILGIVIVILAGVVFAQENNATSPAHLGVTYIKYHLMQDTLPAWDLASLTRNAATPRLTFEYGKLAEIDAYFDPEIPDFTLGKLEQWQDRSLDVLKAMETNWSAEALSTGALWLKIAYDKIQEGPPEDSLLRDEQHLLRGKLNLPLGASSFSLGASVALYRATTENILAAPLKISPGVQPFSAGIVAGAPNIAQTAFGITTVEQGGNGIPRSVVATEANSRNAFSGAVNISGEVKGVNVFTEVGFASGSGRLIENAAVDAADGTDFYALGGAKYKVGRVMLGVEAGFENGNDPLDEVVGNFHGFENDFWSDRVIEDGIPGDQLSNKLYARVSAQMNPLKKINIEGAVSYIRPMEPINGVNMYGVEVNGKLYYSLTKYVKYLIKAGVSSLMQNASFAESQYKLMNRVEVNF